MDVGKASNPSTSNETSDPENNLLVVVLDINPYSWAIHSKNSEGNNESNKLTITSYLEHVQLFLNAYLMLSAQSLLAVIAYGNQSNFVYTSTDSQHGGSPSQYILKELKRLASEQLEPEAGLSSSFSAALTQALCYSHRISKLPVTTSLGVTKQRILVITLSNDVSAQYIPVMNCIFSAQRQNIVVDGCVLGNPSIFLQQATSLTGGIYLEPNSELSLSQYLVTVFLPDIETRKFFKTPHQKTVDFRASCFCHKNSLTIGHVCSVCLSIFCKSVHSCTTCGTKFMFPSLPKIPGSTPAAPK
eukprot:TRINITY_DN2435_c0_g1_i1.p1 TRINITY_DN2435_c0_g1~~TRINITY_DN2435_c0_g1_i1.p1  ORF type:complete len:301 (-),score=56.10 TRINITY_DN2435_c0_g1_i1:204-1106(-)